MHGLSDDTEAGHYPVGLFHISHCPTHARATPCFIMNLWHELLVDDMHQVIRGMVLEGHDLCSRFALALTCKAEARHARPPVGLGKPRGELWPVRRHMAWFAAYCGH